MILKFLISGSNLSHNSPVSSSHFTTKFFKFLTESGNSHTEHLLIEIWSSFRNFPISKGNFLNAKQSVISRNRKSLSSSVDIQATHKD